MGTGCLVEVASRGSGPAQCRADKEGDGDEGLPGMDRKHAQRGGPHFRRVAGWYGLCCTQGREQADGCTEVVVLPVLRTGRVCG